jgi:hypothetical protein
MYFQSVSTLMSLKSLLTIGFVTLGLTSGVADAAHWVSLGKSSDQNNEDFVDTASIHANGDIRRGVFKMTHAPHTMRTPGESKYWASSVYGYVFNCRQEIYQPRNMTINYEGGERYVAAPNAFQTQWRPVPHHSWVEDEMMFICSWNSETHSFKS